MQRKDIEFTESAQNFKSVNLEIGVKQGAEKHLHCKRHKQYPESKEKEHVSKKI